MTAEDEDDDRPRRAPRRARGTGRVLRTIREAYDPHYRPQSPKTRPTKPTRYVTIMPLHGIYSRRIIVVAAISRGYTNGMLRDGDPSNDGYVANVTLG